MSDNLDYEFDGKRDWMDDPDDQLARRMPENFVLYRDGHKITKADLVGSWTEIARKADERYKS